MRTIYKYKIEAPREIKALPAGAIIRKVGVQDQLICVWAEVDTEEKAREDFYFEVHGTGHRFDEVGHGDLKKATEVKREFLETVFLGELVFHVYRRHGEKEATVTHARYQRLHSCAEYKTN
jgi:hypothetical protein